MQESTYPYEYQKTCIKRRKWNDEENQLLLQLTKTFGQVKKSWLKISSAMNEQGYFRSSKQCKDRFNFYLNKTNCQKGLTECELIQLLNLTQKYGNKWSSIAKDLGNRTNQSVKNKFYAHIKKILRRLFKCTYGATDSSKRMQHIKEGTLSKIFCCIKQIDEVNDEKDKQVMRTFKNLIINHHNITKRDILSEQTKQEVKALYKFLTRRMNFSNLPSKTLSLNNSEMGDEYMENSLLIFYEESNQLESEPFISNQHLPLFNMFQPQRRSASFSARDEVEQHQTFLQ